MRLCTGEISLAIPILQHYLYAIRVCMYITHIWMAYTHVHMLMPVFLQVFTIYLCACSCLCLYNERFVSINYQPCNSLWLVCHSDYTVEKNFNIFCNLVVSEGDRVRIGVRFIRQSKIKKKWGEGLMTVAYRFLHKITISQKSTQTNVVLCYSSLRSLLHH